jgi:LmbE family N-acetylglucosaminyl deacetylase
VANWNWTTESILSKQKCNVAMIAAHPDDPDFGEAGTAALWASQGHTVTYVIVTNGDKGSDDRDLSTTDLIAMREREQRAAADALGLAGVRFLGYEDGMVVADLNLRRDLVRVIRDLKADVVTCSQPTEFFYGDGYINHPDHRAVATAALEAIFPAAQNHRYFPELLAEGYEPYRVREVWIGMSGDESDTFVDVTSMMDKKIAALRAHASQIPETDEFEWMRMWMEESGKKADPPVKYAESYKVMRINNDDDNS